MSVHVCVHYMMSDSLFYILISLEYIEDSVDLPLMVGTHTWYTVSCSRLIAGLSLLRRKLHKKRVTKCSPII